MDDKETEAVPNLKTVGNEDGGTIQDIIIEPGAETDIILPVKHSSSSVLTGRERSNLNLRPPFPKGVSGNPLGRPRNDRCITAILRRKLNEPDDKGVVWAEKIAQAMLTKAASADSTKGTASVLKEVLERVEGKVTEDISIRSEGNVILKWYPTKEDTEAED